MRDLHGGRIVGESGKGHQQQMPKRGVPLVLQVGQQLRDAVAVSCEQPSLYFVRPHLVLAEQGGQQERVRACDHEGEPRRFLFPFAHEVACLAQRRAVVADRATLSRLVLLSCMGGGPLARNAQSTGR